MCIAGLLDAMRSNLPASVRIVWQCLENHADHNRQWSISIDKMVAELSLSIETVVKAVRILQDRKIVHGERNGPGRKPTTWTMLRTYADEEPNTTNPPENTPKDAGIKPNGEYQDTVNPPVLTPRNAGMENPTPKNAGIGTPQKPGSTASPPHPLLTHQVIHQVPPVGPQTSWGPPRQSAGTPDAPPPQNSRKSREAGTNPRALGTNPRAAGGNPRSNATNPRTHGTNPRKSRYDAWDEAAVILGLEPRGTTIAGTAVEILDDHRRLRHG